MNWKNPKKWIKIAQKIDYLSLSFLSKKPKNRPIYIYIYITVCYVARKIIQKKKSQDYFFLLTDADVLEKECQIKYTWVVFNLIGKQATHFHPFSLFFLFEIHNQTEIH